ncbi:MAG: 50S ribosomal protein L9 [Epsilonproteobacteria bacterium]|nr:50S ribosomal protein L9 [Campylobacterota bacterium]
MRVLLTQDVRNLGKKGDIKEVKDGYALNFLVPRNLAKVATDKIIEEWRREQIEMERRREEEIERYNREKRLLESSRVKIKKKLAPVGIKGSVKKDDIAKAIREQIGVEIDKRDIELKKSIKSVGEFTIDIKFKYGIHAKVKIEVVGE